MDFVDRFTTTLASGYTSGGGSLALVSAAGLPSGACEFFLIVKAEGANTEEVFYVSDVTGSTLTVEGAQATTSASDHDSGAVVIASIMTAEAFARLAGDILRENKPGGVPVYTMEKQVSVTGGVAHTILNYSGGPGYLCDMWFALSIGSDNATAIEITVDGDVIYSGVLSHLFANLYNSNSWANYFDNAFIQNRGGNGWTIPIPFSSSILITVTPSSSCSLWYTASYRTGVPNGWPRTRKLKIAAGTTAGLTQDQVATLVDESGLDRGRLLGCYLMVDCFHGGSGSASPATSPLEGAVKIYRDGTLAYVSSGTEDYAKMAGFFAAVSNGANASQYITLTAKNSDHFAFVRFHIPDPIEFENALKVTWNAGNSLISSFSGSVTLSWVVWYYTE